MQFADLPNWIYLDFKSDFSFWICILALWYNYLIYFISTGSCRRYKTHLYNVYARKMHVYAFFKKRINIYTVFCEYIFFLLIYDYKENINIIILIFSLKKTRIYNHKIQHKNLFCIIHRKILSYLDQVYYKKFNMLYMFREDKLIK